MLTRPHYISSDIYRSSHLGRGHPLSIPRVSVVTDLIRALGWMDPKVYHDAPMATVAQLARFHDRTYIETVRRAEADGRLPDDLKRRYHIGINGNPIYREVFRRPATTAGASVYAAGLLKQGGVVHSPAGGTHHGRRDQASGFCFFNDPVLGILAMLDQGLERIAYVDLDAHHGDGVQDAFHDDDRVMTISIHEAGRWPYSGAVDDRAGGMARNLPVLPGFNDDEHAFLMENAVLPLLDWFEPQALVIQGGCDALQDDPLSKLSLSNNALLRAVRQMRPMAPRVLVLGGGGYNPWAVARCWTGYWGLLNGFDVRATLPEVARAVLESLTWRRKQGKNPPAHWFIQLHDMPNHGPIRDETRSLAGQILAGL
ncbi:acetoin utilization protein AcuC [Hwanghaeella grinnelliae]|uniref:Acetoin utilization protein AcuC n=1 Tax=Hwanghaeella grinnelliae TaxID=2500179 RepID=A0A3S2Y067_9PROT|nr:acetoin utilization protein AcuC [Hwanghaeella grinnelliae]RVU33891.1 acetoin utilization protein AcuC [Hwanghaeella grinnelliae]